MATTLLEVQGLTVRYGDTVAVRDLDLAVKDGEVVAVLGPSGCGKTTLLRAVAGLERPAAGRIHLDGRDVTDLRPDQRGVGLMFQDHALFPHRTVADNVAFGPRMHGWSPVEVARRVTEVLALVRLASFADRPVTELSGGEQQRVALARALAPGPRLLMLDEPLGSLDRALADELLVELQRIVAEVGSTVLYVTHDQDEALAVADRVVVMRAGVVEQVGDPDALWRAPRNPFVARFLGLEHLLEAHVRDGVAATALGEIPVPGAPDGTREVVLLPDAVRVADAAEPGVPDELRIGGEVVRRRFAGDHVRLTVRTAAEVELTVPWWRGTGPLAGDRVELALDPSAVRVLEPDETAG